MTCLLCIIFGYTHVVDARRVCFTVRKNQHVLVVCIHSYTTQLQGGGNDDSKCHTVSTHGNRTLTDKMVRGREFDVGDREKKMKALM